MFQVFQVFRPIPDTLAAHDGAQLGQRHQPASVAPSKMAAVTT